MSRSRRARYTEASTPPKFIGRSRLLRTTIALFAVALLAFAVVGIGRVFALLGDTEKGSSDSIGTGTLDLEVNGAEPPVFTFNATGLARGDWKGSWISVANTGTLPLRYAVTARGESNELSQYLEIAFKDNSGQAITQTECETDFQNPAKGTLLNTYRASYTGSDLDGHTLSQTTVENVLGWVVEGQHNNGQVVGSYTVSGSDRTLAPSASESAFCIGVGLADNAPDSVLGQSANVTFAFAAEQTANNP